MAYLTITKSYADDSVLSAADLDNIVNDIETFLNTTKLSDDNIEANSITASSKIKLATISSDIIASDAVTSSKLADAAVTTEKILDSAVTAAKIEDETLLSPKFDNSVGLATVGTVVMMHTFNGATSIPRGWLKCDGSQVTSTTYDTTHGAGTATTDGVTSSALLNMYLPDIVDRYVVGTADTTETGTSPISTVGNAGSTVALEHTHDPDSHTHTNTSAGSVGSHYAGDPQTKYSGGDYSASPTTGGPSSTETTAALSATQDIRPESIEFVYIMKVV